MAWLQGMHEGVSWHTPGEQRSFPGKSQREKDAHCVGWACRLLKNLQAAQCMLEECCSKIHTVHSRRLSDIRPDGSTTDTPNCLPMLPRINCSPASRLPSYLVALASARGLEVIDDALEQNYRHHCVVIVLSNHYTRTRHLGQRKGRQGMIVAAAMGGTACYCLHAAPRHTPHVLGNPQ